MSHSAAHSKLKQEHAAKDDDFQRNLQHIHDLLENWREVPLKIAVVGNSGVGKSSFINAIRGLKANDKDKGAAQVGVVQKTVKITKYQYPSNPMLEFWDVPGTGTVNYPRETYFEVIGADKFDFFVIVSACRFTDNDAWLGRELKKIDKRFFFIRTKIGNDLDNEEMAYSEAKLTEEQKEEKKENVLKKIRQYTEESLIDSGLHEDTEIFLIDNHATDKYDFERLIGYLVENFPQVKKTALIFSLKPRSMKILEAKIKELQKRIFVAAGGAAAVALVPVPGVSLVYDIAVVLKESKFYREQLGLVEKSPEEMATETSLSKEDLEKSSAIVSACVSAKGLLQIVAILATTIPLIFVDEVSKLVPIIGPLIASPMAFIGTYLTLKHYLDKLEKEASKMIESKVEQLHSIGQSSAVKGD